MRVIKTLHERWDFFELQVLLDLQEQTIRTRGILALVRGFKGFLQTKEGVLEAEIHQFLGVSAGGNTGPNPRKRRAIRQHIADNFAGFVAVPFGNFQHRLGH